MTHSPLGLGGSMLRLINSCSSSTDHLDCDRQLRPLRAISPGSVSRQYRERDGRLLVVRDVGRNREVTQCSILKR